jgi:branched-chain amino acid transport system substrate-binding protein
MSKGKYLLFGAILLSVLITLPAVSGCAPKAALPEKKYVTFLSLTDLTGAVAGFTVPLEEGWGYYFDDLNSRGGVDGVTVKLTTVDTRYDTARLVSAYKRYRTEHKVANIFSCMTSGAKAVNPMLEVDKYILLTPADGEFQAHIGRVFLAATPYQDGCAACFDWILSDWKAKGKPGMPAVGYLLWDSAYGREPLRGGKEYAEKIGINLLPPEYFPTGASDVSVWLSRIAQGGANYCLIGGIDPTPSLILRDAYKLGLTKTIQFIDATYWGPDEALGIKLHPEATEGAVLISPYLRGDEARNHPLVVDLWTKYAKRPITDMRALFPASILIGRAFERALKIALDSVGYAKLDGEAMYQAYQKLTGFDNQGLAGVNTYGPNSRRPADVVKFYRVQGGKCVPITGWVKTPDAVSLYKW